MEDQQSHQSEPLVPLSQIASTAVEEKPEEKPALAPVEYRKQGLLGPTVCSFKAAVVLGDHGKVVSADRELLIQSLERYVVVLDEMGGFGSYISGNCKKLRASKATATESDYEAWMRSELPVHASTKYKDFVDPSAWVANVWIARILEFMVELFANLHRGMEMSPSIDAAYKETLYAHHNFIMRSAFMVGIKQMPTRAKLFQKLQGDAMRDDAMVELEEFVALGRPVVRYLFEMHEVVEGMLQSERKAYLNGK
jgi:hypothetical protein